MQAAHQTYRRMQTETATPGELISLLYDALVRNLTSAEDCLAEREIEKAHHALLKSQDIVLELMASLDTGDEGDAGHLARRLAPLYEYMYRRLIDASVQKEVEPVAEVQRLVAPVREAWRNALTAVAVEAASAAHASGNRGVRRG